MSPNQLIPSQPYTLSYYITDHLDSNTYYVRAVVYDAINGDVLDTQNLTQQSSNSHLYSKVAQAPGDPSGRGRRIIVVATAYEDSGYTTKSANYQEQSEVYIVVKPGAGMTLGGGYGVDYNVIKEIIVDELSKVLKKIPALTKALTEISKAIDRIPTEVYDLKPTYEKLLEVEQKISLIPVENSIDLTPVIAEIGKAIEAIVSKEVTPATDLKPLADTLEELKDILEVNQKQGLDMIGQHMADLHTVLPDLIKENSKQGMERSKFNLVMTGEDVEPEKPEEKPKKKLDIKNLM